MKRIYWVKKNPNIDSDDNWIKMNKAEFTRFITSGAAKGRCFAQLDACDESDSILIVECSREQAIHCRKEKDYHDNLEKNRVESKIKTVSYNTFVLNEENKNGEAQLVDHENDVIADYFDQCEKDALHKVLAQLSKTDYDLIYALFFCSPRKSETAIAKEQNISVPAVCKKKKRIFKKIRTFFES